MPAAVRSPEDALNVALRRIGYRLRIGSIWDGSFAAKQCLDIFAQTRDQLLATEDWGFSERNVALTLLKSAPVGGYIPPTVWDGNIHPPVPWRFEYAYPSDTIKVRAVKHTPLFLPNFDPHPTLFDIPNDNYLTPAARVIVCDVPDALLVYTGQITDLSTWDAECVDALADELGKALSPVLANLQTAQMIAAEAVQSESKAAAESNHG